MKNLQLSLKGQWFEMTKSGIKTEDYRLITDYWMTRLIDNVTFYGGRYKEFSNMPLKEAKVDNVNLLHIDPTVVNDYVEFKKFDVNIMTWGYPNAEDTDRIIQYEHSGIHIGYGKEEWGAEPNKLYFIIKHGKRIN